MNYETWNKLTPAEKDLARDNTNLSPQLKGLEGWRVEVITTSNEIRHFIVGKSTGWAPCHLELSRRNSMGGSAADKQYQSVTRLYFAR